MTNETLSDEKLFESWSRIWRFSQRLAVSFNNWKNGKGSIQQYSKRKTELYNVYCEEIKKFAGDLK